MYALLLYGSSRVHTRWRRKGPTHVTHSSPPPPIVMCSHRMDWFKALPKPRTYQISVVIEVANSIPCGNEEGGGNKLTRTHKISLNLDSSHFKQSCVISLPVVDLTRTLCVHVCPEGGNHLRPHEREGVGGVLWHC